MISNIYFATACLWNQFDIYIYYKPAMRNVNLLRNKSNLRNNNRNDNFYYKFLLYTYLRCIP